MLIAGHNAAAGGDSGIGVWSGSRASFLAHGLLSCGDHSAPTFMQKDCEGVGPRRFNPIGRTVFPAKKRRKLVLTPDCEIYATPNGDREGEDPPRAGRASTLTPNQERNSYFDGVCSNTKL